MAGLAVGLFAAPLRDFGQREHLLLILVVPYLLLAGHRADGGEVSRGFAIAVGLLAAFGFALKPQSLLVPVVLEAMLLWRLRRPLFLFRPEVYAGTAAALAYLAAVALLTPDYLSTIVPFALEVYDAAYAKAWGAMFGESQRLLAALVLATLLLPALRDAMGRGPADAVLLSAIGFSVAFLLQRKGWTYQSYPAFALLVAAVPLILGHLAAVAEQNRGRARIRKAGLAGLVLMVGLLLADAGLARTRFVYAGHPHWAALAANRLDAESLYVFSSNVSGTYPWAPDAGLRSVSRYPAQWLIPGLVLAQAAGRDGDGLGADRALRPGRPGRDLHTDPAGLGADRRSRTKALLRRTRVRLSRLAPGRRPLRRALAGLPAGRACGRQSHVRATPGSRQTMKVGAPIVLALFAMIAAAAASLFAIMGPPIGHSALWDLAWSRGFSEQFLAGELYPRWIHSLNGGAGSPVFFFYGPLPFWVQALAGDLLCQGCDLFSRHMIGPSLLLGLSGVAFFLWVRCLASPTSALAAALLYVFLPYHLEIDLFRRMALGEFAAYVWMPVILLGLSKPSGKARGLLLTAAGYTGLIASHLPSALLFSPVMVAYAATRYGLLGGAHRLLLGLALAGLYLVPALTTQDWIAAEWWDGHYDARNWLWLDGRDAPSAFSQIVLPALLGPSLVALAILIAPMLVERKPNRSALFLIVCLGGAWFLMTAPSALIWEHVELLRKVQFPWRLGIVVDLCAAAAFALWLDWARNRGALHRLSLTTAALLLAISYASALGPMGALLFRSQDAETIERIDRLVMSGFDAPEYRPTWSRDPDAAPDFRSLMERLRSMPEVALVEGEAQSLGILRRASGLELDLTAETDVRLRLRRFFYPGWSAGTEDGEVAIEPSDELGLIELVLPAGHHRLTLERRALTAEWIGGGLSALALLICLYLACDTDLSRASAEGPTVRGSSELVGQFAAVPERRPQSDQTTVFVVPEMTVDLPADHVMPRPDAITAGAQLFLPDQVACTSFTLASMTSSRASCSGVSRCQKLLVTA